jgi:CRISPR-associated protein Csa3
MRQYIASFGFDTRRITRPVINSGIDAHDQIVLLQPATNFDNEGEFINDRAADATAELVDFFSQIDDDIRIVSAPITYPPFEVAIRELSALVTDAERATRTGIPQNDAEADAPSLGTKAVKTILCPGGGLRELLFPVSIVAAAHPSHLSRVVMLGDLDSKPTTITLPTVNPHIPDRAEKTFQVFVDETPPLAQDRITGQEYAVETTISVAELSKRTEQSRSTVGRHLDSLEEEGVITSTREGKERVARLTLGAELYFRDTHHHEKA